MDVPALRNKSFKSCQPTLKGNCDRKRQYLELDRGCGDSGVTDIGDIELAATASLTTSLGTLHAIAASVATSRSTAKISTAWWSGETRFSLAILNPVVVNQ